jgi:Uma2 family endonuclease
LTEFFVRCLPDNLSCRAQLPIIAGDHSEPEPDIAIVTRRDDYYKDKHPSAEDVSLLVEVSHSSLNFDLGRKLRLYAASGIPEYWVVDVEHKLLHIHRAPTGNRYSDTMALKIGDEITPQAAPGCRVAIDWLFR